MTNRLYSDEELDALRRMPKRVTNRRARWSSKPSKRPEHRQRSFEVRSEQDESVLFEIYQRQSLREEDDFSCGIALLPLGGKRLTLARYNGPSHEHGRISCQPHIHRATARAIEAGRKPECEAMRTDRFETVEGALACLVEDFNLFGLDTTSDHPSLPLGEPRALR